MHGNVFRKVSLDRLASPEQLDQLMQVTTPKGWVALLALGGLLVTGLVWGFIGSIPDGVSGPGILVQSGGVLEVVPVSSGRVVDVSVRVGDLVSEGQVVARLAQPELSDRLQQAQATLEDLRRRHRELIAFGRHDVSLQQQYIEQQRENLQESIRADDQSLAWLKEKIASQDQLVAQGLLTRATLLTTRQQYEALRDKLARSQSELTQLSSRQLSLVNDNRGAVQASQFKVDEAASQVAQLERELRAASAVTSPYTGRVLEIMTDQGELVGRGEPILTMAQAGRNVKELEAIIYVPSVQGKRVRPGMMIQIAPATVKQEEHGLMLGRVTYVSDFPATAQGMKRVLRNDALVSGLAGGDAPYEVHADLLLDPHTYSQYKWTSAEGPPIRIQSGTLAVGNVVVDTRRPIEMVLPFIRKHTRL
jgi:HlyD family secretion protein